MKLFVRMIGVLLAVAGGYFLLTAMAIPLNGTRIPPLNHFPYKQGGLTERQAAAHLLSRFTYGALPGQVDIVVQMGLENWFRQQLDASLPDDSLDGILSQYDALKLSNTDVVRLYPKNGQ